MSEFALEEAKYLKEIFTNFNPDAMEECKNRMHDMEHSCDLEKHEFAKALVKEFLPPLERDDLFHLAHVTDNLTDSIESVVVFFYMANIRKLRGDVMEFADLIIECTQKAVELLTEFRNFKKMPESLKSAIITLNDLEEKGDKLYMNAVRTLSSTDETTREIIEWRDVYRIFETCFDAAESIADNVESAIMKNC